jgi:hypothetical protein
MRDRDPGEGQPMIHRLFAIASLLSLLMCMATVLLWVRYSDDNWISYDGSPSHDGKALSIFITSRSGRLTCWLARLDDSPATGPAPVILWHLGPESIPEEPHVARLSSEAPATIPYDDVLRSGPYDWPDILEPPPTVVGFWFGPFGGRYTIVLPNWFIVLATAFPALMWFRRRRAKIHRRLSGLCDNCGYDLRASKDRCPECGTVISGKTVAIS